MVQKPKRGRPPLGFILIKFFAPREDTTYLDDVTTAQGLTSRSDAARLVVGEARLTRRFLPSIDANIAPTTET